MALVLTSSPAVEPVTLADAKVHLRVDGTDEDTLITGLITAARRHVERSLGRALITQSWSFFLDEWPDPYAIELPLTPLQAITAVTTYDVDDVGTVFDAQNYFADTASEPPRLVLRGAQPWPKPGRRANGIEIALTVGHGDTASDVPQPLIQALMLLIAHWFEQREPVVLDDRPHPVPATVAGLLAPYRMLRI